VPAPQGFIAEENPPQRPPDLADGFLAIACPACGKAFPVTESALGKQVFCSACGAQVLVSMETARRSQGAGPAACGRLSESADPETRRTKPLAWWQLVLGLLVSAPLLTPLLGEALCAVLLRAACSFCKIPEPSFARAWWTSFLCMLVSLAGGVFLGLLLAVTGLPPIAVLPFGMLASMLIIPAIYRVTIFVSYGQGILLWFIQLLMMLGLWLGVWIVLSVVMLAFR
jgi:hypothetical protein